MEQKEQKQLEVKKLILLIGSNPMPNFLSVLIFKPNKAYFCYTPETEMIKKRLKDVLQKNCAFDSEEIYISDAGDPKEVRKAFKKIKIDESTYLNYTGGTKVMSAHIRMLFNELGGQESQAFYIYDRDKIVRFDNGKKILFENTNLKLRTEDILSLHNIRLENKKNPSQEEIDLSRKIASFILSSDEEDIKENKKEETLKSKFKEKYLKIPESFFRRGDWLEVWTGNIIESIITDDPNSSIHIALNCKRENRSLEIDIATIYKHRIYIVSCTTAHKLERCKGKLFEVALRARQLGGDLARSALVCLLYGQDEKGLYINQLRKDISDLWDAPNTPRVFGLDDLREWINGRLHSLKEWLES